MLTDHAKQFLLKSTVPAGVSGKWRVEKKPLYGDALKRENMRIWLNEDCSRSIPPGRYTILFCGSEVWMSDTPVELAEHLNFVATARRAVLITGLGLGVVTAACLRNPEIEHVTVVELSQDVIELVAPSLYQLAADFDKHLFITQGDAFKWKPGSRRWDYAWHDIWPTIGAIYADDYRKIMRHYRKAVTVGQECWQESQVFALEAEEKFDAALGMLGTITAEQVKAATVTIDGQNWKI